MIAKTLLGAVLAAFLSLPVMASYQDIRKPESLKTKYGKAGISEVLCSLAAEQIEGSEESARKHLKTGTAFINSELGIIETFMMMHHIAGKWRYIYSEYAVGKSEKQLSDFARGIYKEHECSV